MKKRLCILLLMLSLVLSTSVFAATSKKGVWKHNKKGWWYEYSDGSYAKSQWLKIDGSKYYFNAAGYRVTGWKTINKKKYRFNAKGIMQTGWKTIDGKKYYFNAQGVLNTKETLKIKGKVYHFNKDGSLHTKHSYKLVSTKKATCTKKGKKTYKCSCGDSYTKTIKATGHTWGHICGREENHVEKISHTIKIYVLDDGTVFYTKEEAKAAIEEGALNGIPGRYGYHSDYKTIVDQVGSYDHITYHVCKTCKKEEIISTEHVVIK